ALAGAGLAFAVLAVVAAVTVPWSWVPGGHLVPPSAGSLFTPEQIARAERYAHARRLVAWSSYGVSLAGLVALGLTPLGARLLRRVQGGRRWWTAVPTGVLVVLLVERALTLPFALVGHRLSVENGLSRQGWGGFLLDVLRSFGVSWVATSVALLLLVGLARRSRRWWFAGASVAAVVLVLAGSFLYPVLVEPVFNRFTPMADGPFKASVMRLAAREGVQVDDVLVSDASRRTTTVNAYVSGFGGTRRIVVYDTLLSSLTPAQARVVIAHELGHARHDDVLLGTALGSLAAVGGVCLLGVALDDRRLRRRSRTHGPADPAGVALVLALVAVGGLLASPVQNTVSRAIEARADVDAIRVTGSDETFVQMQRRFALTSLADPTPPWLSQLWWGSHPTVLERAGLPAALRRAEQAARSAAVP
ncbi:MAG: M48 family metallopeptidase, partial [Nocardioidaceae bacterium]